MNSYRVKFRFYDINPRYAYIQAENYRDAFEKAHAYITPEDDCCEIIPERIKKADVPEYTPIGRIRSPYERKALIHAEDIGVYEYSVAENVMEYWTLYEEGFYFVRYNLDTEEETRELRIPWTGPECTPEFLLGRTYYDPMGRKHRETLYNYFCG